MNSEKKVLITGASGMIGKQLIAALQQQGFSIHILSRSTQASIKNVQHFEWNVDKKKLDRAALQGVSTIIHLAGAGVAEERWTAQRKKELIDSRVKSAALLFEALQQIPNQVKTFISASAVGYYGDCGNEVLDENHHSGNSFLAHVCLQWENAARQFEAIGIRVVCCRIGIVLGKDGGALPELTKTLPLGVAGYFSKQPLFYPWIHESDVAGILIHALQNEHLSGSFNTTAPSPLPIKELMQAIIKARNSNAVLVPVPTIALKLAMGEMADMLLSSQLCTAQKIIASGYTFQFPDINAALKDIYSN